MAGRLLLKADALEASERLDSVTAVTGQHHCGVITRTQGDQVTAPLQLKVERQSFCPVASAKGQFGENFPAWKVMVCTLEEILMGARAFKAGDTGVKRAGQTSVPAG